tara:strand:- start:622 stop:1215 length:594 start_codon:yes stop_codon:yes gene_type:complete
MIKNEYYKFVFDTETSGLPIRSKKRKLNYANLNNYENARIVSISYLILDDNNDIIEKNTYYIKPDNFEVSKKSQEIHGLTPEYLNDNGININELFLKLNELFKNYNIDEIISHNINFDINILKSELFRYNENKFLELIENIPTYCTMLGAQKKMNVSKWPKLSEAYKYFYNENIINAHDAEYDTLHCYKVYIKLISK